MLFCQPYKKAAGCLAGNINPVNYPGRDSDFSVESEPKL